MESIIAYICLAAIVVLERYFESRRPDPKEALDQRFLTEGALANGQVEDIRWLHGIDDAGIFEIRYRYAVVAGVAATKTHYVGSQQVRERENLAMLVGKPCGVRYLKSDPYRSKLEQFPLLEEDIY